MAKRVNIRGGSTAQISAASFAAREVMFDDSLFTLVVGNHSAGQSLASTVKRRLMRADGKPNASATTFRTNLGIAGVSTANTFLNPQTIRQATGVALTIESSSGSAVAAPTIDLSRKSDTPAADDLLSQVRFRGRTSAGADVTYAAAYARINSVSTTAGRLIFQTVQASTVADRGYFGAGFVVGNPTGGDKGAGTINATAVYDDNVQLTDYVFDYALTGATNEDSEPARRFDAANLDLGTYAAFWKSNGHLPAFPGRDYWRQAARPSVGDMAQRLLETAEVQAVQMARLKAHFSARIADLSL